MDTDLPPFPTRIGRFAVLSPLGQGATSQVFLAHDPHLDRQVAIKWLQPAGDGAGGIPAPRFDDQPSTVANPPPLPLDAAILRWGGCEPR